MIRLGFLLILCLSFSALAQEFRRKISLDWEPIPDAKSYEVEIRSTDKNSKEKPKSEMVQSPNWTGKLSLGGYALRVRGHDKRKVPGDWSEDLAFFVGLETPVLTSPKGQEKVFSSSDDEQKVRFVWQVVPGANSYSFELSSKDGKFKKEKQLSDLNIEMSLPVAMEYSWKVKALGPKGINSDSTAISDFSVWGKKLETPIIAEPKNTFVRELGWSRPTFAEDFDYQITRYDEAKKKWITVDKSLTPNQQILFLQKWSGGKYKFTMKANSHLRQSSKAIEKTFTVRNGNRSPAAEEIATLRESIDYTIGWFGIASYLITNLSYSGVNSDRTPGNQLGLSFNGALGGTGRVGIGYLTPKTPWGFLTIGDFSGITLNNNITTFGSLEGSAIYRYNLSDRSELRQVFGLFYKELPVIMGSSANTSTVLSASTIGPQYGLEYWKALSPKLGYQLNLHGYLNALSVSTPNGNTLAPDLSYQLGFLASYRLSRLMTGLAGFAYRVDSISYQANDGSTNRSSLTGNYLNLYLEWQL